MLNELSEPDDQKLLNRIMKKAFRHHLTPKRWKNRFLAGAVGRLQSAWLRRQLKRFLFRERLAADTPLHAVDLFEKHDKFAPLRNAVRYIAHERGEWAGIPMPLEGHPLVIEPRYPNAQALMGMGEEKDSGDTKVRNIFWSSRYRCDIFTYEQNGKVKGCPVARIHQVDRVLATIDVSNVWGLEQEGRALQLLAGMLKHHQLKAYILTGTFLEFGKSGVVYILRRLRPTVALRRDFKHDSLKILACLCMHPIAYYRDSWGGGMCPTDDVIAHLTLIRGDEHLYWRRCNQHAPHMPEAGL